MSHSREVNASLRYALLRNVPKPSEGLFYPWNIDFVSRDQDRLLALGWAAPLDGLPNNTVIYCNGKPAVSTWSADETYHRLLPNWPGAANSGFQAAWPDFVISDDDVLTFEVRAADGSKLPEKHELKFRFADQAIVKCPDESIIAHIESISPMAFVLTGRTLATHFDRLLRSFSGSGFGGAQSVLDWGCGSGRVAQHVAREFLREGSTLRGIDVDSTAIEWCSSNVKGIRFQTCGLNPPTDIPANSTDIIYAYSVLTHLRNEDADAWIAEIRRILKPGGHFVFTTLGTLSLGWLYPLGDSAIASALEGPGIYDLAKNTDIDETILDQEYYRNTWVTEDYVRTKWSEGFDVLGFEPCFHYYQDAWVFRKKAGPVRRAVSPMHVAIAGRQRSGTSMVTRLLNLCGLYLGDPEELRTMYLDLMRDCLTGVIYDDPPLDFLVEDELRPFDPAAREIGMDWPSRAYSMIGQKRMLQLQRAAEFVIERSVPGDFIETGVWRGGACIMLRAVLKAWDVSDRRVWLADSFEGLPQPNLERYPADRGHYLHTLKALAVPIETVRANFARYGLLDEQVIFLKGWFRDTLPNAPIDRLAILRLDGDLYESTMDAFAALYDKVSLGGFVIVDDFGVFESCRAAVVDFRRECGIRDRVYDIDGSAIFWQRGVS